ncbi:MAG: hypothetical protein HQ527_01880 [Cyanobacteria bacterium]|nr:hypothetical protein [Cyanobacteria bacterium bin.51]
MRNTANSQQLLMPLAPALPGSPPLAAAPHPAGPPPPIATGAGLLAPARRPHFAGPAGAGRKQHCLPRGEREPESAYRRRVEAALPSGFFSDALRTFAGMLASSHWRQLPASLQSVAMMTIGAESGAATGPIPAEARRQEGLSLKRPGASQFQLQLKGADR